MASAPQPLESDPKVDFYVLLGVSVIPYAVLTCVPEIPKNNRKSKITNDTTNLTGEISPRFLSAAPRKTKEEQGRNVGEQKDRESDRDRDRDTRRRELWCVERRVGSAVLLCVASLGRAFCLCCCSASFVISFLFSLLFSASALPQVVVLLCRVLCVLCGRLVAALSAAPGG